MRWRDISEAPKTGQPFWLGTGAGGVLLEAWHWCSDRHDFAGVMSGTTLASLWVQSPREKFLFTEMQAPKAKR